MYIPGYNSLSPCIKIQYTRIILLFRAIDSQIRKDINDLRIGHNHQLLESIFKEINE